VCVGDAFASHVVVFKVAFDADEVPLGEYACDAGGAGSHERIKYRLSLMREKVEAPFEYSESFLSWKWVLRLFAVFDEASMTAIEHARVAVKGSPRHLAVGE
jgi:hypothetical protein